MSNCTLLDFLAQFKKGIYCIKKVDAASQRAYSIAECQQGIPYPRHHLGRILK
jgi:hypothetical protein